MGLCVAPTHKLHNIVKMIKKLLFEIWTQFSGQTASRGMINDLEPLACVGACTFSTNAIYSPLAAKCINAMDSRNVFDYSGIRFDHCHGIHHVLIPISIGVVVCCANAASWIFKVHLETDRKKRNEMQEERMGYNYKRCASKLNERTEAHTHKQAQNNARALAMETIHLEIRAISSNASKI